MDTTVLQQKFELALLSLERGTAKTLSRESGLSGAGVIEQLVIPTLEHIGASWENGAAALSQVYMSGKICEEMVDELLPQNTANRIRHPKMAIAVYEDFHLLGKRIVYAVIRAAGYELKDYGRVDRATLLKNVVDDKLDMVLLSTLMLPSALHMKRFCDELREADSRVKVIVGGAPFRFDPQLWKEIGADAMAYSAADAIAVIEAYYPKHQGEAAA